MSDIRIDESEFYERELPHVAPVALWLALAVLTAALGVWEAAMRSVGLTPGDFNDGPSAWAVERRKVDAGSDVVIIGASRILFDTDLAIFEEVTGIRPVQLALPGTNARSFLTDLADDPDFSGLLVVGMTEIVFFMPPEIGLFEAALAYYRDESPSQRLGHWIDVQMQRVLAFLDVNYTLPQLLSRIPMPRRKGTFDPYDEVWKLYTNPGDRQTRMWFRIEEPGFLNAHAKHAWVAGFEFNSHMYLEGYKPDNVAKAIEATRRDIDKIRARGGEVVFVRPPSSDFYRDIERRHLPRDRVFDRLTAETDTLGLHFEDYAAMRELDLPEWSHLSVAASKTFTRAYAEELVRQSEWLQARMQEDN